MKRRFLYASDISLGGGGNDSSSSSGGGSSSSNDAESTQTGTSNVGSNSSIDNSDTPDHEDHGEASGSR